MANDVNPLEGRLEHHCGRRQPTKDESSSTNPPATQPSKADQEAFSEMQNILVETSQLAKPSRGGQTKARANRGRAQGKHAREESGDAVLGGEDVARPLSRFEVDRHLNKIMEQELELIREMYQVPDYVEF